MRYLARRRGRGRGVDLGLVVPSQRGKEARKALGRVPDDFAGTVMPTGRR